MNPKEFHSVEEVFRWIDTHYTSEQITQIRECEYGNHMLSEYKGWAYDIINFALRNNASCGNYDLDIDELKAWFCNYHIPDDIWVSRFISLKEWYVILRNTMHGKIYTYPSFLSTTLLPKEYAMDEIKKRRIKIQIAVPKGTNGVYLPEINPNKPEYEILIKDSQKIRRKNLFCYEIIL